jgi:hypothetical protein
LELHLPNEEFNRVGWLVGRGTKTQSDLKKKKSEAFQLG